MSRPDAPPPGFDPYRTLQVDPEADPEVIQAAYRRLALKFHPDVAPGSEAAARMIAINMAWEMVGDPVRRAAYDASRRLAAEMERRSSEPTPAGWPSSFGPGGPTASRVDAEHDVFDTVSRDRTTGRSTSGSGYDPATMGRSQELGSAGPPPGRPSGSVLNFGRYAGWSIGEIARIDPGYLEWLDRAPIGRGFRDEIDPVLRRLGRRRPTERPGSGRDRPPR